MTPPALFRVAPLELAGNERMPDARLPDARLPDARLIDSGLVPHAAARAGAGERYRRGETPHTIHVWWARRPHAAMRALVFACLCRDDGEASRALLERLASPVPDEAALAAARALIAETHAATERGAHAPGPRVLDMFGGGGTIPLEAARLGAAVHALDHNELAVFVQRTLLEHAPAVPPARLLLHLEQAGARVLDRLARDTAPLFPRRPDVLAYLWSYSLACARCGYRFLLVRRPWLSRRRDRRIGLRIEMGADADRAIVHHGEAGDMTPPARRWIGRGRQAACPRCGHVQSDITVDGCRDELLAVVAQGARAKAFAPPEAGDWPGAGSIAAIEDAVLRALGHDLPGTALPCWSGVVNPPLHGLRTHADLLNPRQRAVLLLLIRALRDEHAHLRDAEGALLARAVIALLSGLIDQLVDWNCRLSMWISQNEQVGRAFCGPGIAMLWDHAETDPVGAGPSNLHAKLARILAGARGLVSSPARGTVHHGSAQALPFADADFDAVITDPPYYDNVFYSALADCFHAWKRMLLHDIEPALFARPQTSTAHELVASSRRHGDAAGAHRAYCDALARALGEAERVLRPGGVLALVYSHGSLRGWQALVHAYRRTGLEITSVQPLPVERRQRPRAMSARAVNTCVVLVARRRVPRTDEQPSAPVPAEQSPAETATLDRILTALAARCLALRDALGPAGWHEDDIALAAYAQGVAHLANIRCALAGSTGDDLEALRRCAAAVRTVFPSFAITERASL